MPLSLFSVLSFFRRGEEVRARQSKEQKSSGRILLGTFLVLCVACFAHTSAASAARGHELSKPIGAKGSAAGQLTEPSAVAVNEATGDVYVLDTGNDRVDEFEANGTFVRAWGGGVAVGGLGGLEVCGPNTLPSTECQKGVSGEVSPGEFGFSSAENEVSDIAVDNSCRLHELSTHVPLTGPECATLDPSNGDVYVADPAHNAIDKFTPEGALEGPPVSVGGLHGIAVDTTGQLWAATGQQTVVNYPEAKNNNYSLVPEDERQAQIEIFTNLESGFAVDATDHLYVHDNSTFQGRFVDFLAKDESSGSPSQVPLGGDEAAPTGVAVELSSSDAYVDYGGSLVRYSGKGEKQESLAVPGEHVAGVGVSSSSETVYLANLLAGTVEVYVAQLPSAPAVLSTGVTNVSSESAEFTAEVNPDGAATEYAFEYGRCPTISTCPSTFEASVPVPDGFVGADFSAHKIGPTRALGLAAGASYHVRVRAHNEALGVPHTSYGEERTFTTQTPGGFALADSRQWELVSPADKHGAPIGPITEKGLIQAAAAGSAISYLAFSPVEGEPAGNAGPTQILSDRGASGWSSRQLSIPHGQATGSASAQGLGEENVFFSPDLSSAVLQPVGAFLPCHGAEGAPQPCLSEAASEQTPFSVGLEGARASYTPLVTGCPATGECAATVRESADVAAGTVFGLHETGADVQKPCPPEVVCGPLFRGASPDAQHVIVTSYTGLKGETGEAGNELYEWNADAPAGQERLQLVSVLPANGSGEERPTGGSLGSFQGKTRAAGAVSEDGSRVVFESGEHRLYLRDTALGKTVQLDAPEEGCVTAGKCQTGGGEGVFQFMNAEGMRVFFTDTQRLTENAGAQGGSPSRPDLYECGIAVAPNPVTGKEEPKCNLRDLTPLENGEAAAVQGGIVGASSDGSYVYFVADGVREGARNPGAVHGDCSQGPGEENSSVPGDVCNLYVWHGSVTRLVGVLSGGDFPDWDYAPGGATAGQTGRVAPDGRYLAFMSDRSLTGYDNHDASSGKPDEEVYLYHAPEDLGSEAGKLTCASCNPAGARPHGVEYGNGSEGKLNGGLAGGDRIWKHDQWIAANIPGWTAYEIKSALYQSRYLSNDGRLFFNSGDSLVPKDVNGQQDVYQYEPQGVGNCEGASSTTGARTYKPGHSWEAPAEGGVPASSGEEGAGCVALISSGRSPKESGFLDASETGGDVFFLTSAQLAPQDYDTLVDVYDAHECTAKSPCTPQPATAPGPCVTEASCKPAPEPQPEVFGAPASATFSGPGNVAPPPPKPATSSTPPCSSSSGAPSGKCSKKQNLGKALATCKRKYPHNKKKRSTCEATARHKYTPKPLKKKK